MLKGIDVSHYNRALDWQKVKSDGVSFVSAKSTEGIGMVDTTCADHLSAAKDAGIDILGTYHFFHPKFDGEHQAKFFLEHCPFKLDWYALDFEAHDNLAKEIQLIEAQKFLDTVERDTGKIPWICMGESFADELKNPAWFGRYPLWLMRYCKPVPPPPKPWHKWDIWQNSESGTVAGVDPRDKIDTDLFNGDLDQFRVLLSRKRV